MEALRGYRDLPGFTPPEGRARFEGFDPYASWPQLRDIYRAPLALLYPDKDGLYVNDTSTGELWLPTLYRIAARRYGDEDLARVAGNDLFLGPGGSEPPAGIVPEVTRSHILPAAGFVTLRAGRGPADRTVAIFSWGDFSSSHDHSDGLQIGLFGKGRELAGPGWRISHPPDIVAEAAAPAAPPGRAAAGYRPLEEGTVRIWDANEKYAMKHYDFRAWKDRARWSLVPRGEAGYEFRGDCILEGKNFWISLHSSPHDAVFLYLKLDAEGTPSRHNEIYRVHETPNGFRNYGPGSQPARVIKNEPGEIVVESRALPLARGGTVSEVTTRYRLLGGKPWVEIIPVSQADEQGMHGETRLLVAPEAGRDGRDWIADSTKHPNGHVARLPPPRARCSSTSPSTSTRSD